MAFSIAMPWNAGEERMHELMRVPENDNPTSTMLTPRATHLLQICPLLAVGTLDDQGRPWTTIWGGEPGFGTSLGSSMIGIRTLVDARYDPVVEALNSGKADGKVVQEVGSGRMIGGLAIDLDQRRRVKLYGRLAAGALDRSGDLEYHNIGQIQMVVRIEQSIGNCPKYLNRKVIRPALSKPRLLSESPQLTEDALRLLERSDMLFITSANKDLDMDTNHRGGPPGFVRVLYNGEDGAEIVYPEYSGNRLYQTLGNLQITPVAGLVFPDFVSGDVLYVTGKTEILIGKAAADVLPRSNLAVKVKIIAARLVEQGLPFRGKPGEYSPYNPSVRLLAAEGTLAANFGRPETRATLVEKEKITPTITRYRFSTDKPINFSPGQWVALDFAPELDLGYSHMRDDDPSSLNDDFIRTFTVSSSPTLSGSNQAGTFEITVRAVGRVTTFLSQKNPRAMLEVPIRGFGGELSIKDGSEGSDIPFIAGGVGITPLLGQLDSIDRSRLRLFWTLRAEDVGLAAALLRHYPDVQMSLYITGSRLNESAIKDSWELLQHGNGKIMTRRFEKADFEGIDSSVWYLCTSVPLRAVLLEWLQGKNVVYEDFNF
ncbi:oxidoreductase FAD-binding protein [Eremomyces bilateralis CBS 781.70]|uniref:Oxidoreductase FAD-binding protein n=1 Tax=Eremomyces bilateralis CBS 781.70 TaxID=1392243 RepID=A0A6G1G5R2_9PEZI|nr:oxidoreductase FAD-binding protein [Eremomyces bilateralis CBS 781.70]KAF1813435.1 oxidoreductase FAD-binding protein [Eremomyces bilateralis CBS 781.70]